jgi:hypothetical protein
MKKSRGILLLFFYEGSKYVTLKLTSYGNASQGEYEK